MIKFSINKSFFLQALNARELFRLKMRFLFYQQLKLKFKIVTLH